MRIIPKLMIAMASFAFVTSVSAAELMTHDAFKKVASHYKKLVPFQFQMRPLRLMQNLS